MVNKKWQLSSCHFYFGIYTLCLVIKLSKNFLPELLLLISFGLCLYHLDLNWFNSLSFILNSNLLIDDNDSYNFAYRSDYELYF